MPLGAGSVALPTKSAGKSVTMPTFWRGVAVTGLALASDQLPLTEPHAVPPYAAATWPFHAQATRENAGSSGIRLVTGRAGGLTGPRRT